MFALCDMPQCGERALHRVWSDDHPVKLLSCTRHIPYFRKVVIVRWRSCVTVAAIVSAMVPGDYEDWRTSVYNAYDVFRSTAARS